MGYLNRLPKHFSAGPSAYHSGSEEPGGQVRQAFSCLPSQANLMDKKSIEIVNLTEEMVRMMERRIHHQSKHSKILDP